MLKKLDKDFHNDLVWFPRLGYGYQEFHQDTVRPYDLDYFQYYIKLGQLPLGLSLNRARVDLVNKYTKGMVCDVGIGCGTFIQTRATNVVGHDINPAGEEWLKEHGLWHDITKKDNHIESASFWDCIEHIPDPSQYFANVDSHIFASLPVFKDADTVVKSRHYKPGEHCWYFTDWGFVKWMEHFGFHLLEMNQMETDLGRESISSFVFSRA